MNMLTKDQILTAQDLKTEVVEVPEWGGTVRVSEMSGQDYAAFVETAFPGEDADKGQAKHFASTLVAFCVVDEAGERIFSVSDIDALARKSKTALERVFEVADRLNVITKKAREAAEKN